MQKHIPTKALNHRLAFPFWILIGITLWFGLPTVVQGTLTIAKETKNWLEVVFSDVLPPQLVSMSGDIAPLFTPQVQYWGDNIQNWASTYDLDPNLLATVMQIESCGHPTVGSSAGAQGLFQVMPFHFASTETMTDPDTNAMRGALFLNECLRYSNGDPGMAMACYNGGPSVVNRPFHTWHNETQRYYIWGTSLYTDATMQLDHSPILDNWLSAGGQHLCRRASMELGIRP